MFLNKKDCELVIKEDHLDMLVHDNTGMLDEALLTAQSEQESYLAARFDVASIYAATGNLRHPLLKMYMTDMALYHLHSRISPRSIPQLRFERYERAIKWLKMVAAGELTPDLPLLPETRADTGLKIGSRPARSHQY